MGEVSFGHKIETCRREILRCSGAVQDYFSSAATKFISGRDQVLVDRLIHSIVYHVGGCTDVIKEGMKEQF